MFQVKIFYALSEHLKKKKFTLNVTFDSSLNGTERFLGSCGLDADFITQ